MTPPEGQPTVVFNDPFTGKLPPCLFLTQAFRNSNPHQNNPRFWFPGVSFFSRHQARVFSHSPHIVFFIHSSNIFLSSTFLSSRVATDMIFFRHLNANTIHNTTAQTPTIKPTLKLKPNLVHNIECRKNRKSWILIFFYHVKQLGFFLVGFEWKDSVRYWFDLITWFRPFRSRFANLPNSRCLLHCRGSDDQRGVHGRPYTGFPPRISFTICNGEPSIPPLLLFAFSE